jgi:hypothetical protein
MDLQSLRDEWKRLSDDEAPPAMSKELLRLAIAYRKQEQEFGGLSRRTSIRLWVVSPSPGVPCTRSSRTRFTVA